METEQQQQQQQPTSTTAATEPAADSSREVRSPLHKKQRSEDAAAAADVIVPDDGPRTVVIAVDGGEQSRAAFNFFLRRFRRHDDKIIFVHIQTPPTAVWKDPNEVWHSMVSGARDLEKQVIEEWCSGDQQVSSARWVTEFCSGAGAAIVKVAHDNCADLIVMGSRGLGTVRRTILGSVSSFVMHHTQVPLIVVPPASAKKQ